MDVILCLSNFKYFFSKINKHSIINNEILNFIVKRGKKKTINITIVMVNIERIRIKENNFILINSNNKH